ncbi:MULTISPECIES: XRE family transcriptional regulator [Tenacibaculum]|uniref:LexA family transcriptional regulator n=1 Tax=Tenacibaculum aiptasiae TaxID=426481 RepID=A0A7J5APN1_9FLAO|nr:MULTISPECIES: LexA family transcriptional regulator [Tenacibaculum]KAB1159414.1 LexA family transcriptional regulator [Tenacibaculum aiptasiae]MCF2875747.1 LexA family transcriptional regulator [Tenacibaculum sp. Cn5-1]MCF2935823.1 LexA family transcriptional regulator [Tenacibaculum sp. Cn5-34]MCG7512383.1 LexA family transcriptional regulator [Tenacibaculum sp. Cn5-46]
MRKISTNIRHLRKLRGLTQEQFAEKLDITRSRVSSYEEGRSEPSIEFLITISDYFKLPIDVLVKNDLTFSKESSFIEIGSQRVLFPIMVDSEDDNLIEIIPTEASAGYLLGYDDPEYIEQLQRIKLPFLPVGKHRAFPIKGDSMHPMKDGSFVVARFIENINEVKDGVSYIIVTKNDGITYKRVYDKIEENKTLLLVPDNRNYQSYNVPISEVVELWEFTCSINTQEYDERDLKISSIATMLTQLGVELKSLAQLEK